MAAIPSNSIDIAERLRFITCAACGVAFAVPMSLHTARAAERGEIWCPNGHASKLGPIDASNLTIQNLELLEELKNAREELHRAQRVAATATARVAEIATDDEVKRRCRLLSARAERTTFGRIACTVCGRSSNTESSLRNHLFRAHKEDVRAMNAEAFE